MANGIEEHGARLTRIEEDVRELKSMLRADQVELKAWRHGPYTSAQSMTQLRQFELDKRIDQVIASLAVSANRSTKLWELVRPVIIALITGFVLWLAVVLLRLYPMMR